MGYRSKSTYQALVDSSENADALQAWGYSSPTGPTGLTIVYDEHNKMVSAVLSSEDFADMFEEIPPVI